VSRATPDRRQTSATAPCFQESESGLGVSKQHLGIGRIHIIMLVNALDLRIINLTTGVVLRYLTLDHQSGSSLPTPPDQQECPQTAGSRVSHVSQRHIDGLCGTAFTPRQMRAIRNPRCLNDPSGTGSREALASPSYRRQDSSHVCTKLMADSSRSDQLCEVRPHLPTHCIC